MDFGAALEPDQPLSCTFMGEHLILFIDFLGFAEAVREWDPAKMSSLIELLGDLASLRGEFTFAETPIESGKRVLVQPAITTFSDHIVMSYPTDHILKLGGDSIGTVLTITKGRIGALAAAGLSLGLLIRGGATVGQLYHSGGVVVGEAMNEAYHLESRVSIYPRITISRKIYSQIQTTPRDTVVLEDHDGITHFNYFTDMILEGGRRQGSMKAWLADAREIISENVERFEKTERWNELAKWVWFKKHLEQARTGLPDALFQT